MDVYLPKNGQFFDPIINNINNIKRKEKVNKAIKHYNKNYKFGYRAEGAFLSSCFETKQI